MKVDTLSKAYGQQKVLDDVSFSVSKGEIVGLLGRNGAGKSTLLKIIAGINIPDKGVIHTLGLRISFLSEHNPLYHHLYVREYLSWVKSLQDHYKDNFDVEQIIKICSLEEVSHKKINQLSKGFKQRLGLAAALISNPDLLILDEPINGLDPLQIIEFRKLIKDFSKDRIVILSSHLMQEIEALCDRVLVLKDGKIKDEIELSHSKIEKELYVKTIDSVSHDQILTLPFVHHIKKSIDGIVISMDDNLENRALLFDALVTEGNKILEMRLEETNVQNIL